MSSKLVRQARRLSLAGVMVSVCLWIAPVQAQQVSDAQVGKLVDALKQAAQPIDPTSEGLVSAWKIKPENIPRWSRLCTGKELTPAQFSSNQAAAREILVCVMRDVLSDEYKASGNNESVAVQRAACWWMTGQPNQCNTGAVRDYTQKVLSFYQQGNNSPTQQQSRPPKQPASQQSSQSTTSQSQTTPQPSAKPPTKSSSPSQISDTQVGSLVEALRMAAPQTDTPDDGLYSEWQVKAENIPRWSKQCNGQELTPTQFQDSPVTARAILVCIMRDVLREQYTASNNNESIAVQRAASWWMTGDANQYSSGTTAAYTQKVLDFYKQSRLKFFSHI